MSPNNRPRIKLPADVAQRLKDAEADIDKSYHEIEVMNSLGMDTTSLKERLDWASQARKIILREFE